MLYEFSLPTKTDEVPRGPDWLHEVKYDSYRMMLIREQERVRLIRRGGYDLMQYFPSIVEAALKLRQQRFVIDSCSVLTASPTSPYRIRASATSRYSSTPSTSRRRRRGSSPAAAGRL
jgi:ATP-dependent DNA ligase